MQWRDAACLGADPTWFDERDSHTRDDWSDLKFAAQRYCAECPMIAECRAYATANGVRGLCGGRYRHLRHGAVKSRTFVQLTTSRRRLPVRAAS